ncbi:hypothetical protein [Peribacillus frigoritolerans]|uniref:Virion structural protein n=1 Tax=Peribacillus castrilensis TaxID=2897690 RepID=A0AAW9NFW2_9BACI|nr:hypothetical protein [Peribacillus castrilensis]
MSFFDNTATLQLLTQELEKMFVAGGWSTYGRYRVVAPVAGDSYRKKFGEVTLFKSLGSDGQVRNFGMIHGYGGKTPTPLGEEPVISQNSELGLLGIGDGTKLTFNFKVFPLVPGYESIFVAGVKKTTGFTVNYEKGTITFTTAPAVGQEVRSTFSLTDNAPETPARLWFFTYEDVRDERVVLTTGTDIEKTLTGTGSNYTFNLGANLLKQGSVTLYKAGTKVPTADYTVDYTAKTVTFTANPPTSGQAVTADFIMTLVKDASGNFGDFVVADFDPHAPKALADACLKGLNYVYPSIPTVVSFIPDNDYGFTWTRDSQMYYWGNITKDRIAMFFRVDPAPNPEKTFFAPLYIGKLSTIGKSPRKNNVIIGGGRVADEIPYTANMKLGGKTVDYGANTSNGNSSVMLQQSHGGAYYQKYYLAFITHDIQIDDSAEARFNPSVYSGMYHISPCYIVHPSDGYVGRLDEVYAIHPKNISQLDELEVIEQAKDEEIGIGDGTRKVFPLFHSPAGTSLVIKRNCVVVPTSEYVVDKELKTVTFNAGFIPTTGAELLASYDYKQVYRYTLADTPNTPFQLANVSPYAPIGLGILKENL